ncbi:MAG: VWA domain-containing protein [Caldilineae bacterium]|nr:VWA domain-containing protein [Caldilineae bacterium]
MRPYLALIALLCAALALTLAGPGGRSRASADPGRIAAACRSTNPYLVSSLLARAEDPGLRDAQPALLLFRDAADAAPEPALALASQAEVGDVYGLAFDAGRGRVYAAAYHRAGGSYGPGGPGAIYQVDLASGAVELLASLPAGPDRHAEAAVGAVAGAERDPSVDAAWVGKAALGDLEIVDGGAALVAVNLHDGQLYRIGLPDGAMLGHFAHGAARERWGPDARAFGLGYREGWLYHGLVDSRERDIDLGILEARVYRSRVDGSGMESVLRVGLQVGGQYSRPVPWLPWDDAATGRIDDAPMLVDIEFDGAGDPILGLRDRQADMVPACIWSPDCGPAGPSAGDVLPARPRAGGNGFEVIRQPPWYRDTGPDDVELGWGGLARLPGIDLLVMPGRSDAGPATQVAGRLTAYWLDNNAGYRVRSEPLFEAPAGLVDVAPGDIEVACALDAGQDPELAATLTAEAAGVQATLTAEVAAIATATAEQRGIVRATQLVPTQTAHAPTQSARSTLVRETATALAPTLAAELATRAPAATLAAATRAAHIPKLTAVAPTANAVATQGAAVQPPAAPSATAFARAYAEISASCGGDRPFLATTNFVPMLDGGGKAYSRSWLAGQPAVIAFNDTDADDLSKHHTLAWQPEVGAVFGVAQDLERDHVYVSAYDKRLAEYGPLGPGGIYRIELDSGIVRPWAWAYAGFDNHRFDNSFDQLAGSSVGLVAWGDIELDAEATQLFAVNLFDRMIYRYRVPSGELIEAFPHGAAGEAWAEDARPFGLAWRDGWLYHGLVDSLARATEKTVGRPRPLQAFVYRSRPDGSQMEEVARVDLDYGRQPAWEPWLIRQNDGEDRNQPMLVDIEFREDGDLVLGLRDRQADARILGAASGDMVLTMDAGSGRYIPLTVPEFYQDNLLHAESSWGTLASMPWLDQVVSTAIDPVTIYSGGAAWFDNISGYAFARETVYAGANVTFGKAAGLGDIEALCFALTPTPTATHTPTQADSPTPSATPTASVTASLTPSITPTATPSEYIIYIPFIDAAKCVPEAIFTDAVLVLDMSTSMYRQTRGGRSKHEAAIEAARLFVSLMDLEPDRRGAHDRVGIVGFNDRAWTEVGLSNDRAAVDAGLDRLLDKVAEGTRLDLALEEGQAVLDRGPRVGNNQPVMILLTDGLPNRVPFGPGSKHPECDRQECTVLHYADRAKAAGTRLFAVGLGLRDDVLDALLAAAASSTGDFYFAPDGEDLADIYRGIAGRLTECPD